MFSVCLYDIPQQDGMVSVIQVGLCTYIFPIVLSLRIKEYVALTFRYTIRQNLIITNGVPDLARIRPAIICVKSDSNIPMNMLLCASTGPVLVRF